MRDQATYTGSCPECAASLTTEGWCDQCGWDPDEESVTYGPLAWARTGCAAVGVGLLWWAFLAWLLLG